jgi:hypothetical protein
MNGSKITSMTGAEMRAVAKPAGWGERSEPQQNSDRPHIGARASRLQAS